MWRLVAPANASYGSSVPPEAAELQPLWRRWTCSSRSSQQPPALARTPYALQRVPPHPDPASSMAAMHAVQRCSVRADPLSLARARTAAKARALRGVSLLHRQLLLLLWLYPRLCEGWVQLAVAGVDVIPL